MVKLRKISTGCIATLAILSIESLVPQKIVNTTHSYLEYPLPSTLAFASSNLDRGSEPPMTGTQTSNDSRGDCPVSNARPLIRLSPLESSETVQTTPTVWFYIPYAAEDIEAGTFVLQNAEGYDLAFSKFSLPSGTPGLVGFEIPYELTPQDSYQWYFSLYCDEDAPPLYVHGWMRAIEPSAQLNRDLAAAGPIQNAVYQENRLWFDSIDQTLSRYLEGSDSPSLSTAWGQFLAADAINLDKYFQDLPLGSLSIEKIVFDNMIE